MLAMVSMMVQRVISNPIIFKDGKWTIDEFNREELYATEIQKRFLPYQWGIFVTAWARMRLHQGYRLAQATYPGTTHETFVYADTDSIKSRTPIDFTRFNKARIRDAKQSGAWATDAKGEDHYMGVFESEGKYDLFKTLGAKRYCVQMEDWCTLKHKHCTKDCVFHSVHESEITVAGVPKAAGSEELKRMGGIEKFTFDMVFRESGKTRAVYKDRINNTIKVDGHRLHITRCVTVVETEYAMSMFKSYMQMYLMFDSFLDEFNYSDYNKKW